MANRRVPSSAARPVRNIRKITRTMQLISNASLGAVQPRRGDGPYTESWPSGGDLSRAAGDVDPPFAPHQPGGRPRRPGGADQRPRASPDGYNASVLAHGDRPSRRAAGGDHHRPTWSARRGSLVLALQAGGRADPPGVGDRTAFHTGQPIANALIDASCAARSPRTHVAI